MEQYTSVQILREDKERIDGFKIHPAQPVREVITKALDLLEQRQRSAKNGASVASETPQT